MKNLRNDQPGKNILIACTLVITLIGLFAFTPIDQDPVARLGERSGGEISAKDFKGHDGLNAIINTKDEVKTCKIIRFELVRVAPRQDPVKVTQHSGTFSKTTKALVNKASTGDLYYIEKVIAKCPGDTAEKKINSLIFKIK